ncbi:MAG: SHOCT domain-containing protein [Butyrivibrio sp.]|nr:SHOCT domain-containing protein [Butyrivibrio sp.]
MICPKCRKNAGDKFKFCPFCGAELTNTQQIKLTIVRKGQRFDDNPAMTVFIDEEAVYYIRSAEKLVLNIDPGWHSIKFIFKIREKTIDLNINQNTMIEAEYNTLSGLIETVLTPRINFTVKDGKVKSVENAASSATEINPNAVGTKADPSVIAEMRAGNNKAMYEIKTTTGFLNGTLYIYANRVEFITGANNKTTLISFNDVKKVEKKMGNIDIVEKDDNHNIFVIPREKFTEVFSYLNEHVKALSHSEEEFDDEKLRKLKALYDEGILTQQEYESKKRQILGI